MESSDTVHAEIARLTGEGLFTDEEIGTTCCFATQDKVWVTGPAGEKWEVLHPVLELVVDSAFSIGQIGVADTAGLDAHHHVMRAGIGQNYLGEFDGSMRFERDDTTDGLRHGTTSR